MTLPPPGEHAALERWHAFLADDVAAWSDVPAWARMKGHTVTLHDEDDGWTAYRVVLGARQAPGQAPRST